MLQRQTEELLKARFLRLADFLDNLADGKPVRDDEYWSSISLLQEALLPPASSGALPSPKKPKGFPKTEAEVQLPEKPRAFSFNKKLALAAAVLLAAIGTGFVALYNRTPSEPGLLPETALVHRDFPQIPVAKDLPLSQEVLKDVQSTSSLIELPVLGKSPNETAENLRVLRSTDKTLTVKGRDGGFVLFEKTEASSYRVEAKLQLIRATEDAELVPFGFALILKGAKAPAGAPLGCEGVGINYDRYADKILVKSYPSDETILDAFTFSDEFDVFAEHEWIVEAAANGEYTVSLDGKSFLFHDFSRPNGLVGLRVWGNSGVRVRALTIKRLPEPLTFSADKPRLQTVVVGVGNYQDQGISPIPRAKEDAEQLFSCLGQLSPYTRNGFLLLDQDAREENILYTLGVFPQTGGPSDVLLVYIAGHGVELGNGRFYFLTPKTQVWSVAKLQVNAIEMKSLADYVRVHKHGLILLVLDHCHAGGITGPSAYSSDLPGAFEGEERATHLVGELSVRGNDNMVVLAATSKTGVAHDGVFASRFLKGLKGDSDGYGSSNKDGRVTLLEVVQYTIDKVSEDTGGSQKPIVSANVWRNQKLGNTLLNVIK
ncbi:MAG: caspase family protein [Planctomycetes bacterium]|nr:caspase family protein [Planctomycetota bacterium]